jgi:hypothetical protein
MVKVSVVPGSPLPVTLTVKVHGALDDEVVSNVNTL